MAIDVLVNNATTTVSSGGTDAPAAGTSESWTVASSAEFPAITTGVTQFRIQDPALPAEIMIVTAISGTTWTVTRGAEGTTPVAHAANFTVDAVATAGGVRGYTAPSIGWQPGATYQTPLPPGSSGTSQAYAVGDLVAFPMWLPGAMTIAVVYLDVNTAGAGDSNFIGFYQDNGQAYPGKLVGTVTLGSTANGGVGANVDSPGTATIGPGLGWVAYYLEAATTAPVLSTFGSGWGSDWVQQPAPNYNYNGYIAHGVTGSLPPSTFPAPTPLSGTGPGSQNIPILSMVLAS